MILPALFFYLFAGICVASAVMVIVSRNPVHSVLFLILAFVNASGLFVLLGAEFLAMILVVVYVGAVAVLFLFVIMMLDVDFAELREGFLEYLPIGLVIGAIFLGAPVPAGIRRRWSGSCRAGRGRRRRRARLGIHGRRFRRSPSRRAACEPGRPGRRGTARTHPVAVARHLAAARRGGPGRRCRPAAPPSAFPR